MNRVLRTILGFLVAIACAGIFHSCSSSKGAERTSKTSGSQLRSKYADHLDVPPSRIEHLKLYDVVEEWRGTPYRFGGQSKNGVDCSAFVGKVYREVYGKDLPRQVNAIYNACDERFRSKSKLRTGDLVFFDIQKGKKASHAGIYLKNGRFVHASSSSGVVISKLSNPYYQKHFHRGGRIDQDRSG
ncbi:MAG: C40 family peptidase [Flavobacteriales bacterium]